MGNRKRIGVKIKCAWAEFSTLSWPVFVLSMIAWLRQERPHLELKVQPRFCPVSLSLSMDEHSNLGDPTTNDSSDK